MRTIVIAGGSGFLGNCLIEHWSRKGDRLIVLTRSAAGVKGNVAYVQWDGKTLGSWTRTLEGADVLINLTGKSVDCRYTKKNKRLILSSRLDATTALGKAILSCTNPPKLWINSGSATIYKYSLDKEMDEYTGAIGSGFSVDVCQQWEGAFNSFDLPSTRQVILRISIILGKSGGALQPLKRLAKLGLGGKQGPGNQYFSWLHERDFLSILDFLIANQNVEGPFNLAAPVPVTNEHLMRALRKAVGMPFGLPTPTWLLEFGAFLIGTESELVLKSRRVVPAKLLDAGFRFRFERIDKALEDLVK